MRIYKRNNNAKTRATVNANNKNSWWAFNRLAHETVTTNWTGIKFKFNPNSIA